MKIARRVTLTFAALVLVMVAAYAYVEISDESRDLRASLESKLSLAASEIVGDARDLDPAAVTRGLGLPPEIAVRWVALAPGDAAPVGREHDGRLFVYRAFVDRAGQPAALEVSQTTEAIDGELREATAWTIGLAALILVLATLYTGIVGSRLVGRPIEALIARFHRVGAGDLSPMASAPRDDELGRLARELDVMILQLAESRASVAREHAAHIATQEQLRHSDRLATVGRLASGLAHELGTPLNVISGYAKMIATRQDTGADAEDGARIIGEQTVRMTELVRQLLDFARRGAPKLAATDVRTVVTRALAMMTLVADKRGVRLVYAEPAAPVMAGMDAARFEQVIVNLLVNAIHASPAGAAIELALEAHATELRLAIVDHGTGIAPDELRRIFEPFFTTKPVGEGTGLGLAVSHGIVEEHGGRIEVESELGAGSRFSVYLPATP